MDKKTLVVAAVALLIGIYAGPKLKTLPVLNKIP